MIHGLVLRNGQLQKRSISVAAGKIVKAKLPEVDLRGYWILPGIIDIFSQAATDRLSQCVAPHACMKTTLRAVDQDARMAGITTAYLAQSWSNRTQMGAPARAAPLLKSLSEEQKSCQMDLHTLLCCDTQMTETQDQILRAVERHNITFALFQDRFTRQDLPDRSTSAPCLSSAYSSDSLTNTGTPRFLCNLATRFEQLGIHYGSVGDPNGDTRERYSMLGARICVFPNSNSAAQIAKAVGDPIILAAADILRPSPPNGGFSALQVLRLGLCDILASRRSFMSLPNAALKLVDDNIRSFPEAWDMISKTPAHVMGLFDRGVLENGKRADITVINRATRQVEMTISGGRIVYATGQAARQIASINLASSGLRPTSAFPSPTGALHPDYVGS